MKSPQVFLVGIPPAAQPHVIEAARAAFPHAELVEARAWPDAASSPGATSLIVLGPDIAVNADALKPDEFQSSPSATVVILGTDPTGRFDALPAEDWTTPRLTRAFRHALAHLELRRENSRLVGDLKTIARRVSHDLRSPVGSIHTSADVLAELTPDDAATILSMADIIKQSSGEISQIVDRVSVLTWASVQPAPLVKIDLADILANVLQQLEETIGKCGAAVVLPQSWPSVRGVATWVQAIWTNLINNALQHSGPAPKLELAWAADPAGYRFTITDHGPGVAAARIAGLFTPFERLYAVRVPGLGLSIVQRLVALQGGTCGHEIPADGGACFYFTLPAPAPTAPALD